MREPGQDIQYHALRFQVMSGYVDVDAIRVRSDKPARYTIPGRVITARDARMPPYSDAANPHGTVSGGQSSICKDSDRRRYVSRASYAAVGANRKAANGRFQAESPRQTIVGGLPLKNTDCMNLRRHDHGNIPADCIHHTAQCVRPVKQRGRPANHFDTFRHERVYRDRMIGGGGGQIAGTPAIFDDKQPVAAQPPQDRTSGRRPHRPHGNAGLVIERFGDRRSEMLPKSLAPHIHIRIGDHVGLAMPVHDDLTELDQRNRHPQDDMRRIRTSATDCYHTHQRLIAYTPGLEGVAPGFQKTNLEMTLPIRS